MLAMDNSSFVRMSRSRRFLAETQISPIRSENRHYIKYIFVSSFGHVVQITAAKSLASRHACFARLKPQTVPQDCLRFATSTSTTKSASTEFSGPALAGPHHGCYPKL